MQIHGITTAADRELYNNIKRQILRLQSGGTLESIARTGADISNQIGASFHALRELARRYGKNAIVAKMLWEDRKREEQIVAVFMFPLNTELEETEKIISGAVSYETAEYAGSQWIAETTECEKILTKLYGSKNDMIAAAMIAASARLSLLHRKTGKKVPEITGKWISKNYDNSFLELAAERYRFKFNKS